MQKERRKTNGTSRRLRLAAGSVSAPLAIVINYIINDYLNENMKTELVIAVSSLVGSFMGVGAICFYDVRDMLLSKILKRRQEDKDQQENNQNETQDNGQD